MNVKNSMTDSTVNEKLLACLEDSQKMGYQTVPGSKKRKAYPIANPIKKKAAIDPAFSGCDKSSENRRISIGDRNERPQVQNCAP